MAYLVLAAGAVMVLIGAMAIVTGYPIIQVERGWATVIAGTSLLAGGIVTMALALVLRALMDLRFALATPDTGRASFQQAAGTQPADRSMEPLFASRNEPVDLDASHRDHALLGAAALAVPAAALALHEMGDAHSVETHPVEEAAPDHETHALDTQVYDEHAATVEPPAGEHLQEEGPHEPSAPRLDDWLDRAFADLHEPAPPVRAEPVAPDPEHSVFDPATSALLVEHAPATQLHDDHLEAHAHVHEPHHDEQAQEAVAHAEPAIVDHVVSQPTSAVIGRYEADGTFYTMYADGSIDAQSDTSLYRFASMAELKAFIEG